MAKRKIRAKESFFRRHSLSTVTGLILTAWIVSYCVSDPESHVGSFFGNAIADWTGVLVTVLATKFWYEKGSMESRQPDDAGWFGVRKLVHDHSLTIFLGVTGLLWIALFAHLQAQGKWGQVIGNMVSEWTQLLGLLWLTKRLVEPRSKESK